MTLVLRYAARSDRGLVRSNNQDSVYAGPRLLALADGMGGHAAGEVASKVVIASLAPLDDDEPGDDLLAQLREAVSNGNGAIAELVSQDPDLDGMGTTLTAVLFAGTRLGLVHVGDSRAYLLRGGQFAQITRDDSFVNELLEQGRITPEEAAVHPQRSLLLKALTGHEVEPSLTVREARAGDRYLICSDGLSGMVSDETMAEAVLIKDPQDCADRMIELALKGGGTDNVTVIIADVVDVDFGDDAPIVGGAAGDGSDERHQGDSPAARARALTQPPPPQRTEPQQLEEDPKAKRRKRFRWLVGIVVVLVVLAAAAIATRYFVLSQYYVGEGPDEEVVIYRGVPGSILGIQLHSFEQGSCPPGQLCTDKLRVPALQEDARIAVRNGVKRESLDDARKYIDDFLRLNKQLTDCKPVAPPGGTTSGVPTAPGGPPSPSTSPSAPAGSVPPSANQPAGRDCSTSSTAPTGGGN
ncbi:PP2C family protein-serine/threonine phosphatase [Amycolatopsis saalfeldensis]|uniref:Serine/threonine protein phosphatase PstP n=1 Tax=Amycolatopsis saalfeldensis TaxID=394193 RepID=A0A1H8YIF2_9PSEU|nr:PP2C family serine/threonine-protein phosphatase [Amycolatopsis saalfeldensis]SEP51916.1 protein phosphatase [Amycolatopsis saalfeldensis]